MVLARYPANFSYWPVVDSYAEDPFLPLDPLEALMTAFGVVATTWGGGLARPPDMCLSWKWCPH